MNPLAVVGDADQLAAPLLDITSIRRGQRIDAVFQQLLDDAGGPLDDLAGRNLVDDSAGNSRIRPVTSVCMGRRGG